MAPVSAIFLLLELIYRIHITTSANDVAEVMFLLCLSLHRGGVSVVWKGTLSWPGGGSLSWGSLSRGYLCHRDPPPPPVHLRQLVVRILLKCIFVDYKSAKYILWQCVKHWVLEYCYLFWQHIFSAMFWDVNSHFMKNYIFFQDVRQVWPRSLSRSQSDFVR